MENGVGTGFGSAVRGGAGETPDGRVPEGGRRRARSMLAGSGVALWTLALLTGVLVPPPLPADVNGVHGLTVKASRGIRGAHQFAVGPPVEVCFDASGNGFVSPWSRDAHGVLERIVPHELMPERSEGMPASTLLRGGRRTYCVGRDSRLVTGDGAEVLAPGPYKIVAEEPVARSGQLLFWASGPEEHPDADAVAERAKATLTFQYETHRDSTRESLGYPFYAEMTEPRRRACAVPACCCRRHPPLGTEQEES